MTSLNPVYSCGEQVAEAIRLHLHANKKSARLKTLELFKKVKLPNPERCYDAYPHQLSGGQKQRVMIAMAISCQPRILIADEPTTALDVSVQASILDLLKELQEETGMGMIFITHDLGVISRIAQRVEVMYKGKIVESGLVPQVFQNPQHPYTQGLLACRPINVSGLRRLPVIYDFMNVLSDGSVESSGKNIETVFEELKSNEVKVFNPEENKNKTPLLKVNELRTWFPVGKQLFKKNQNFIKAIDDVSFDVYPGETLGLVGESGSGKTTLGRTLLRLIESTSGEIIYNGIALQKLDRQELRLMRKKMQIIFQDPYSSLNPRMTAGDAVAEPLKVHRLYNNNLERKEKVIELLIKVGLNADHYNRYPHQFSGGQRQRIGIARALSLNPEFIICDESVSALDVSVQAQVLNLLNQLKKEQGLTYIFISHDLSVVRYMSDRIMVMNQGKIEEIGFSEDVYNRPQSAYTKKLLDAIPH
jgi:peptide/nickel transport system ATP-binding protein